jgi:hypothetical protein
VDSDKENALIAAYNGHYDNSDDEQNDEGSTELDEDFENLTINNVELTTKSNNKTPSKAPSA